nr:MAG TPA: hypothetical protein [Caudoviricetes sp.]
MTAVIPQENLIQPSFLADSFSSVFCWFSLMIVFL